MGLFLFIITIFLKKNKVADLCGTIYHFYVKEFK